MCSGAYKNSIMSFAQFLNCNIFAYPAVVFNSHPFACNKVNLMGQYFFGKPVFGYSVEKHPAGPVQRFIYCNSKAKVCKVVCSS